LTNLKLVYTQRSLQAIMNAYDKSINVYVSTMDVDLVLFISILLDVDVKEEEEQSNCIWAARSANLAE